MASTIVTSSLKVKITETINLNGRDRGSINELTIGGINEVSNRVITTPSGSFTTLFNVVSASANVSAGSYALPSSQALSGVTLEQFAWNGPVDLGTGYSL